MTQHRNRNIMIPVLFVLLILTLFTCSVAMAAGTYAVGTETETLDRKGVTPEILAQKFGDQTFRNLKQDKSINTVSWVNPPDKVYAISVNSRVQLSWEENDSTISLHSIYEKINGRWVYLDVTSNSITYYLNATDGRHIYGISSVWYSSSTGNFYESDTVRYVEIDVFNGDDTPGYGADIRELNFSGYTDQTISLDVYDNTYLHITTDALTWYVSSDLSLLTPDMSGSMYVSLGNDFYIRANKHVGHSIVGTYEYTTTYSNSGQLLYVIGEKRAYFKLLITNHGGSAPTPTPTPVPTPAPTPTPAPKIPLNSSNTEIYDIEDQIWNGKSLKPKVTVYYNGSRLAEGQDYETEYINNDGIGKATVTITGIGKYTGSKSATFIIIPKAVSLSSLKPGQNALSVSWKQGKQIDGYEIEYGLSKSFSNSKKLKISKSSIKKVTIGKLTAGKKYYVRIRAYKKVKGKTYYSEWSKAKNAKVKK